MNSFTVSDIEFYLPSLRHFALKLTRNRADADDLVQDTVERALKRQHQFKRGTNLRAWLFTICRNHFLSGRRKLATAGPSVPLEDAYADVPAPGDQFARLAVRDLKRGWQELSDIDRAVITDVVIHGNSYADTAERMGVRVGTVKSRLSRARSKLQGYMDGEATVANAA